MFFGDVCVGVVMVMFDVMIIVWVDVGDGNGYVIVSELIFLGLVLYVFWVNYVDKVIGIFINVSGNVGLGDFVEDFV